MNSLIENKWSWVEGTHGMRSQLMGILSDADLSCSPGGQNMTLGALLREIGEIEHAYVQSFKNFKQDFNYRNTEAGLDTSVERLSAWFQSLDDDMKTTLSAMSEADTKKEIERPGGFKAPVEMQLDIYLQALLIFFGKATIYLKAMNKEIPQSIQDWIG